MHIWTKVVAFTIVCNFIGTCQQCAFVRTCFNRLNAKLKYMIYYADLLPVNTQKIAQKGAF